MTAAEGNRKAGVAGVIGGAVGGGSGMTHGQRTEVAAQRDRGMTIAGIACAGEFQVDADGHVTGDVFRAREAETGTGDAAVVMVPAFFHRGSVDMANDPVDVTGGGNLDCLCAHRNCQSACHRGGN